MSLTLTKPMGEKTLNKQNPRLGVWLCWWNAGTVWQCPGLIPNTSQNWDSTCGPGTGEERQEDQQFKASLDSTVNLRPG